VCFSPEEDCAAFAVDAIDRAETQILVNAYGLTTSSSTVEALVRAKKRGVDVRLIADRTTPCGHNSGIDPLARAGIPIWIDRSARIAHSKSMTIDGKVTLTGLDELDGRRCIQLGKPQPRRVTGDRSRLRRTLAPAPYFVGALFAARRLVPSARDGRLQVGIADAMKQDQRHSFGWDRQPLECFPEPLKSPEIVGEIENPALEAVRRFRWRAFDSLCGCFVSLRLWLFDRIHGPELPTAADLQREIDQERLVRAFFRGR
jgi:hypothetical protein